MTDNPQERIRTLILSINKKKGYVRNWLKLIAIIFGVTVLIGTGIGLIFGSLAKWFILGIASGGLLSIEPVIKIKELASKIDIDEREITTLKQRVKKESNNSVSNASVISSKQAEKVTEKKDYITDSDMDKMIDVFKKPDYGFRHDMQNSTDVSYDDNKQNRHR